VSTIERAAERLAKAGLGAHKRADQEPDSEQTNQAPTIVEPVVDAPLVDPEKALVETAPDDQASPDAVETSHPRTQVFVGGGYHEIDLDALQENGFVTPGNIRSGLAKEFRRIKRPLLINAQRRRNADDQHPANLIVVTSSIPGEGKTFVSINLAMSIAAEVEMHVLLVDADAVRGSVSDVLGLEYDKGLSDALARGGSHLEDSIFKTNVDHLSVLPSGSDLPNADELLASELMDRVVRDLAEEDPRRIVIFDTPPLLVGTEAGVLSRLVGQVVVVVEADATPQATVTEALSQLEGHESVSLVLNKVQRRGGDHGGYGYGYEYGA
jgi:protein-tyrosine kinase